MITKTDLQEISEQEAFYDFLETDEDIAPVHRPMARILKVAQTFKAMDLYTAEAELNRDIEKQKKLLEPKVFKQNVASMKKAMEDNLEKMEKERKMVQAELEIIEKTFDMTKIEQEYQLKKHEEAKNEV